MPCSQAPVECSHQATVNAITVAFRLFNNVGSTFILSRLDHTA